MNNIQEVINELKLGNSKADSILIEKQVHALALLTGLKRSGLEFIFKGGTSLILHFSTPTRLSLDIDITVDPGTDISDILNDISVKQPFYQELLNITSPALINFQGPI